MEAPIPHVYDWPWDESWHIDAFVGEQALQIVEGGELATKPRDHTRLRFNYTGEIPRLIDADPKRRDQILHAIRAGHYGNLSFIDEQVGGVIDALSRRGDLDDTIVVWTSDHGAHLGDHDLIHKGTHYDSSARVPFVVRWPGRIPARQVDGFSGHVDLLPTLLSLAGIPVPDRAEGVDLTPMLMGEPSDESGSSGVLDPMETGRPSPMLSNAVQDEVFIEIRGNVSVVTDRWKLGLYPHDTEGDLYDLADDPYELINRYEDPALQGVREELTGKIMEFSPVWPPGFSVTAAR